MELSEVTQPLTETVRPPMRTGYFERLIVQAPPSRKVRRSRACVALAVILTASLLLLLWFKF